jgi:hypothetical protein
MSMGLAGFGVIAIVLLVLLVPVLVLVAALRGGEALPRIVKLVAYAAIGLTTVATLLQLTSLALGSSVSLSVPVEDVAVKVPAGVVFEPPLTAQFSSASFDRVSVVAHGLSEVTRGQLMASWLLGAATIIAVCVVVLRLSSGLNVGDPFTVGAKALTTLGWIVLVGWTLAEVLGQIGACSAASELFGYSGATLPSSWGNQTLEDHGWPAPHGYVLSLPLEPMGAALAFALLAAVFRHGERLRQDADGLV